MKRIVTAIAIIAVAAFIAWQFMFADRRSRLKVDSSRPERELSVLTQETSFNESINSRHDEDAEEKMIVSLEALDQILIKNGSLFFEVADLAATRKKVTELVKDFGGYISSDQEENFSGGPSVVQTVRISSARLDDFVARVSGFAKDMKSKTISTKDVTEEYIDLEARLATKKDLEKSYRDILRRATKVSEMLEVEHQLELVRGEIESMQGRMKYINSQVEFSTLSLSYFQVVPLTAQVPAFGTRIVQSLENGWNYFLSFIAGILTAWPFLIVGGIAIWFIRRWYARKSPITSNQSPITSNQSPITSN